MRNDEQLDLEEHIEEPVSLRDELRNAVDELKVENPQNEDLTRIAEREDRARGEDGKFVKAEGFVPPPKAKTKAAGDAPVALGNAVPAAIIPLDASKAPSSLAAPMRAKFAELTPDWQQEIIRRETDAARQISMNDGERILGKQIVEDCVPYMATINAEGGNPREAFKLFLNTAHILRYGSAQQKSQALVNTARQYGVDLPSLLQQPNQPQLHPDVAVLRQQVEQLKLERQNEALQRQQTEYAELSDEINTFAAEPGHEHFLAVKTLMGTLLESGHAANLQDAYDRAVYASPEIRSTLQQPARQQSNIAAKKRASGSVTGSPGSTESVRTQSQAKTLRDEIREAVHSAEGRA